MKTLVFVIFLGAAYAARNVTVRKCCPFTKTLTSENKCNVTSNREWDMRVFSRGTLLGKNHVPSNWHFEENSQLPCAMPALLSYGVGNYVPFQNGSLFVVVYNEMVHPGNFCLDYKAALICLKNSREPQFMTSVEVKKCCGHNAIFSDTNKTCINFKNSAYNLNLKGNVRIVAGFPNCEQYHHFAIMGKFRDADMFENGTLVMKNSEMAIPVGNYCLEHVFEDAAGSPNIMVCQEHVTVKIEKPSSHDLRFTIYPIGLALSAVFLAATLAAGAILPASHHVLHWRCQTNHVFCLLVGDVLLCITQLSPEMNHSLCVTMAIFMHFLFLAAFFWLNTMCFNIWWTFRDLRPQSAEKSQERFRLRLYHLYAYGVPLVIAGTAAILDTMPDGSDFLRPKFGVKNCWFYGNMEILTFFYGPVGILLLINLALFALTAHELTCGLWKRELVKSTSERAALGRVCMKLLVVMGVSWIADVLSWIVGGPQELWYLTDLINCFQGVFIFIVVGCQPQVLSAAKRLWCLRKHRSNGTAGTTNHHSSSSQGMPSMGDTVTNNSVTNNTKSIPLETSC